MQPRNIPATMYLITSQLGVVGILSTQQMNEMYTAGWDFGSHTHSHTQLPTLTQAQQESEFTTSYAAIDALGYSRGLGHVAYPYGQQNEDTLAAMAATGMFTGRVVLAERTNIPPVNNYLVPGFNIARTVALETVKAFIDAAISEGKVASILFHSIVDVPTVDTQWSTADFQAFIDYVIEKQIQPITISQFYALQSGNVNVIRPW